MPVRFYSDRLQGGLSALAEGASQGIGLGMQMRQMKRQEERDAESDRRYEEEKALAIKAANERTANDVFRKNLAGKQDAREASALALREKALGAETQSAQDIATQGVTSGLKEGAMGPHDQEDEFALDVARRMSPEMLPRFMEELHRERRTKMLVDQRERHLSDLQSFGSEPGAQEFMTEDVQARLKGAFDDLSSVEDPEQLSKLLPLTRATIDGTRELLAERSARKQEVESVGAYYQQQLATDMQNAMMERNPAIKAWKLQQLDQQRRYLGAFMTSKPGSVKTADFMAKMSAMDNDFPASMLNQGGGGAGAKGQGAQAGIKSYADALVLARKILGDSAKVTEEQLRGLATQLWDAGRGQRFDTELDAMPDPITGPTPGANDLPFAETRPGIEQTGGAQPQPKGGETPGPASPAIKYDAVPVETRKAVDDALLQAVQEGRRGDLGAILQQAGIDPATFTAEQAKALLDRAKAKNRQPSMPAERGRDTLRAGGPF